MKRLDKYYRLVKPGILRANLMTAIAGFLFGARGEIGFSLLLYTLIGTSGIIASACIANNIFDRDIDGHMERTKNRGLVSGDVSFKSAVIFSIVLFTVGVLTLYLLVSNLVLLLGLLAFVDYVLVYTPLKPRTYHATFIGGVSGSMSLIAGYTAASGSLDKTALLLFLAMMFWQMPHFYAIALFRKKEYKAANIPIVSIVKGEDATRRQIIVYILFFTVICISMTIFDLASVTFGVLMSILGIYWLLFGIKNKVSLDTIKWAKSMFGISLLVLTGFSILLSLDFWLP